MTRGMFVTVLGRMENIDPTQADASGFMDVPEDAYYAGYVGWAARSGIVVGVPIPCLNRNAPSVVRKSA